MKYVIINKNIDNKERNYKMNKIHKNLNIDNLIKTEYFKQLDSDKKRKILINSKWFD